MVHPADFFTEAAGCFLSEQVLNFIPWHRDFDYAVSIRSYLISLIDVGYARRGEIEVSAPFHFVRNFRAKIRKICNLLLLVCLYLYDNAKK